MTVDLPDVIWRSVRYALRYQHARLGRKVRASGSPRTIEQDSLRLANLDRAISAIEQGLDANDKAQTL